MAKMFPSRFPQDGIWAERQTFDAFQELDDNWTVLYSVAWQSMRNGREGDGEADFVLIHPDHGILVAEVKGGSRIEILDGEWFSQRRGQMVRIKNPFSQATDSKHFLGRWLSERVPGFQGAAHIGHFVVFPAHTQEGDLGPDGPRIIICDQDDLRNPRASLDRVGRHWAKRRLTPDQITQVGKELRPTISIKRFLRDRVEEVTTDLEALTEEQFRALGLLQRQRRIIIQGAAGTGKTVLATARARELDRQGFRTLLLCYNKLLSDRLRQDLADTTVTVDSFHGLCDEWVDKAGLKSDLEISDEDDHWETVLPGELPDAAKRLQRSFEAIVVDEGQDFLSEWWTILDLLFDDPDDGFLCVFADTNQDIFRAGWEPPDDVQQFSLTINCRNTLPIAERVHALCEEALGSRGVDGIQPVFAKVSTARQLEKTLGSALKKLTGDWKLKHEQVMVLTANSDLAAELEGQRFETARLRQLGEGREAVRLETVGRFKGLESDAVILLIPGEVTKDTRRLAYVGMSRAKAILIVIGSEEAEGEIDWPGS